jgi:hypothetical protein
MCNSLSGANQQGADLTKVGLEVGLIPGKILL